MSPQSPETLKRTTVTTPHESLLDTFLGPEFTITTLVNGPLGFDYLQPSSSYEQNSHHTRPQEQSVSSRSSFDIPAGVSDTQRIRIRGQQIFLTETLYACSESTNSFSRIPDFDDSQHMHAHQQNTYYTKPQQEETRSTDAPITPPGIEEYFVNMEFHHEGLQSHASPVITPSTTPPGVHDFQRPHVAQQQQQQPKYVPNFSRPFSRSNPPAKTNPTWRTRMLLQEIQEDVELVLVDRFSDGDFAERILRKRIEVLRKDVAMIDSKSDELKRAVEMSEAIQRGLKKSMGMESNENDDDNYDDDVYDDNKNAKA